MTFFLVKPIRLKGPKLAAMRIECFLRDNGKCQACKREVYLDRGFFERMHMAHIKSRGAGGSDILDNVRTLCMGCHIGKEHTWGPSLVKPVPPKEAA